MDTLFGRLGLDGSVIEARQGSTRLDLVEP